MPKKIKGPTDHVVIVGAGLAGLSAALRLAGAGRKVTVLEKNSFPGGRNGILKTRGYSFDTGPSVLTMPNLIADALSCVGEKLEDWLELNSAVTERSCSGACRAGCSVERRPARHSDEVATINPSKAPILS